VKAVCPVVHGSQSGSVQVAGVTHESSTRNQAKSGQLDPSTPSYPEMYQQVPHSAGGGVDVVQVVVVHTTSLQPVTARDLQAWSPVNPGDAQTQFRPPPGVGSQIGSSLFRAHQELSVESMTHWPPLPESQIQQQTPQAGWAVVVDVVQVVVVDVLVVVVASSHGVNTTSQLESLSNAGSAAQSHAVSEQVVDS
jgi:hypothetical protein